MALDPEAISRTIGELVRPDTRGRLLARGLARGMVWRNGIVPEGGQEFSASLTSDLLDFGYGVLSLGLELRDANRERAAEQQFETEEALRVAAEAIESAVRRGDQTDGDQGRHLVVGAAAFHLAGYAARSFSLLPSVALNRNLSSPEKALAFLLRRDLPLLRDHIIRWLGDPGHEDEAVGKRLLDENDEFGPEDAVVLALSTSYHRGLGLADTALLLGNHSTFESAVQAISMVVGWSANVGNIPIWWVATLTLHLLRDLWDHSLHVRLPSKPSPTIPQRWFQLRRDFIDQLATRQPPNIDLWPSQIAAASRVIDPTDDLVIALPTSAGKTRIAELCILRALADERRIVYVTPLRSLSAQIERVLARTFVPLGATVTSLYGASGATRHDTKTLASANIVVATPEKLDFALRQDAEVLNDVALIVFDEGHMIGMGSREIRYEVLIQRLLRRDDAGERRIVCLSAMFNPEDKHFKDFADWLRHDAPGDPVHVVWRPTRQRIATLDWNARSGTGRLGFVDGEKPFVPRFVEAKAPQKLRKNAFPFNELEFCICAANAFAREGQNVLVYCPQRSQTEPLAREFRHMHDQGYLRDIKGPQPEYLAVAEAIGREWLGAKHAAVRALEIGVGTHHGALPRPFLNAVEELLDARRLPIVVASPTLAQGIDLACGVLIFRSLKRYENGAWTAISPAEFGNVVGRAGRAYVDLDGVAVLPTFDAKNRASQHALLGQLVEQSRGQRLFSGLALAIWNIVGQITTKLGIPRDEFLEYVLNHNDFWADSRLAAEETDDDDGMEDTLEAYIADLDVALFSLVEPLDTPVGDLATLLDEVLKNSLWRRTLSHEDESIMIVERAVLQSRAGWVWKDTTAQQRQACFYSGLGRQPGLFIHDQLDALIDSLSSFQTAVALDDGDAAANAAVSFATAVTQESFFSVRKLPEDWEDVLKNWVRGGAFSDILHGRGSRDTQRTQAFVQDGIVFRLVWAAEAVRAQATAADHPRAGELGDGPAFALTYGVPSVPAAFLCQMGFASRVGSVWVSRELSASFSDMQGLRGWLSEHDALLSHPDFWESEDHRLLWNKATKPVSVEYPRPWSRTIHPIPVEWKGRPPPAKTPVRIVPGNNRTVTVCEMNLTPIGTAQLPVDPHGASLNGKVIAKGVVEVAYFGQN